MACVPARCFAALALAGALALGACGGSDELPGRGYLPPSNVTVSRSIPLTVPPDFGVRPEGPEETASGMTVVQSGEELEVIEVETLDVTMGEQMLLVRAGVPEANPHIRRVLERENAILAGDRELVDRVLYGEIVPAPGVQVEEGGEVQPDVVLEQGESLEDGSWIDDIVDVF